MFAWRWLSNQLVFHSPAHKWRDSRAETGNCLREVEGTRVDTTAPLNPVEYCPLHHCIIRQVVTQIAAPIPACRFVFRRGAVQRRDGSGRTARSGAIRGQAHVVVRLVLSRIAGAEDCIEFRGHVESRVQEAGLVMCHDRIVLIEIQQIGQPGEDERGRKIFVAGKYTVFSLEIVATDRPIEQLVVIAVQAQLIAELMMTHGLGPEIERPDRNIVVMHPGGRVAPEGANIF